MPPPPRRCTRFRPENRLRRRYFFLAPPDSVQPDSVEEAGSAPDVIRHLVLLGDALENIDLGVEQAEAVLVPRPRNPWKLTVLEPPPLLAVLRPKRFHAVLPR